MFTYIDRKIDNKCMYILRYYQHIICHKSDNRCYVELNDTGIILVATWEVLVIFSMHKNGEWVLTMVY